jgi:hypothetical protein
MVEYLLNKGSEAAVNLRFRTLVVGNTRLTEKIISKKHVLQVGPYLLISIDDYKPFVKSDINGKIRHSISICGKPRRYLMLVSDSFSEDSTWKDLSENLIRSDLSIREGKENGFKMKEVNVFMFKNADGIYYGSDPTMDNDGSFAKYFYPKTEKRPSSGYIDSERYFLNALLAYKKTKGIKKMGKLDGATFDDAEKVIGTLKTEVKILEKFDVTASCYIKREVLPLAEGYVNALKIAGYDAEYFFDPCFTINAGSIRNLGRAFSEYKHLASKPEMAVTAEHESRYGKNSFFAEEGKIWRIAPMYSNNASVLLVESQDLNTRTEINKGITDRYIIPFKGIDRLGFETEINKNRYIIPGQI